MCQRFDLGQCDWEEEGKDKRKHQLGANLVTSHLVVVNVPVCGVIPDAEQAHQAVIRHLEK